MFLHVYTCILVWLGRFLCESFVHTAGLKQIVFQGLVFPEDDACVGIGKLLLQPGAGYIILYYLQLALVVFFL